MNMFKKLLCMIALVGLQVVHAGTYYRVINAVNKPLKVGVWQLVGPAAREVGHWEPLQPGEIKTVETDLADCIDQVWVDDGSGWKNTGGGVCAGSVVCITDEANYIHPLAKPYYGQRSQDLPCNPANIGSTMGISTGMAVGSAGIGIASAATAGAAAGIAATGPAAIGVAGAIGTAALGCGVADVAVLAGFCKGSAGTFSAQDWQDWPESTGESRKKARAKS